MAGEWISAARAYEIVSGAIPLGAATAICTRANDGLIRSRAKRLAWGSRVQNICDIPAEFWWARGDLALHQNWVSGDFETWIDHQIHCRAYGVEFFREDIETMLPAPERPAMRLDRSKPGNYASAHKCREELKTVLGCDEQQAEEIILRACTAGLVSGRCAEISWRVTDRYGTTEYQDVNVAVPDWFWEHCLAGAQTILNWSSGRFAGKGIVDDDEYKATLSGVEFQVRDVVELEGMGRHACPEAAANGPVDPTKLSSDKGGRRRSDHWRPWIAELVAHIHEKGYPEGVGSQGQEELIQSVADALARRGQESLARSTVQPVVQAVLDRLRAAEK